MENPSASVQEDENDYEASKKAFLSEGGYIIIYMRGLSYDCTAKEVVDFFDDGDIPCSVLNGEDGVLLVKRRNGRPIGDAFVKFKSEEDASTALAKHRKSIRSRYIELRRCTTEEASLILDRRIIAVAALAQKLKDLHLHVPQPDLVEPGSNTQTVSTSGEPDLSSLVVVSAPSKQRDTLNSDTLSQQDITSGTEKSCLRLRGLPYEAHVEHVLEFLGDRAEYVVFHGVHMVYNAMGQPSGEAFIQMDSERSAFVSAESKHRRCMRGFKKTFCIDVIQCSGQDMNLVLTGELPKASLVQQAVFKD